MPVLWLAPASTGVKGGGGGASQNTILVKYYWTPKLSPVSAGVRVGAGLMLKP